MNTICIHHNDADGRASAAIVRRAFDKNLALIEMNHGDPVPWEAVEGAARIVMVDFSLPKDDMLRMAGGREFIWIDHHISAIRTLAPVSSAWLGIRDPQQAACVLTWRYFFPGKPVPESILLIGDRDTWQWSLPDTGPFNESLYQQDTAPENDALWGPLLDDDRATLESMIAEGRVLREARLNHIRRQVETYGFPVEFEGHLALAINARGSGDIGEYARGLGYEIAYCYIDNLQNGRLMTFVGLISDQVDVSQIAQKFGGGGHRGAAGFSFQRDCTPFPPGAAVREIPVNNGSYSSPTLRLNKQ